MAKAYEQPFLLYSFLKGCYRHKNFEGENEHYPGYSQAVTERHRKELERFGCSEVSRQSSLTTEAIYFDQDLALLTSEAYHALRYALDKV